MTTAAVDHPVLQVPWPVKVHLVRAHRRDPLSRDPSFRAQDLSFHQDRRSHLEHLRDRRVPSVPSALRDLGDRLVVDPALTWGDLRVAKEKY